MMNKKNALLMSVAAAALIAGAGFGVSVASAQAPPSPAAEQNAPAEKTGHEPKGASQNKAPDTGVKSGKADEKMEHKGGRPVHAQDNPKADGKPGGMRSETKSPGKTSSEMEADPRRKGGYEEVGKDRRCQGRRHGCGIRTLAGRSSFRPNSTQRCVPPSSRTTRGR